MSSGTVADRDRSKLQGLSRRRTILRREISEDNGTPKRVRVLLGAVLRGRWRSTKPHRDLDGRGSAVGIKRVPPQGGTHIQTPTTANIFRTILAVPFGCLLDSLFLGDFVS